MKHYSPARTAPLGTVIMPERYFALLLCVFLCIGFAAGAVSAVLLFPGLMP